MHHAPLVRSCLLALCGFAVACFDPDPAEETTSAAGSSSSGGSTSASPTGDEPASSTATSSTPDASTSSTDPDETTTGPDPTEDPGETETTSDDDGSTSTGSVEGSSSTGPGTIDPEGPYGDCAPEDSCPDGTSPLGCAMTDEGQVCLPGCNDGRCPDSGGPTPAFCVGLVGGESACLVLCQQDEHCPPGLTCQEGFGAEAICAWP